jgi:cytochrome c556
MTKLLKTIQPTTILIGALSLVGLVSVSACGEESNALEDRVLTADEQILADAIENRQYNMKDMGSAFKSIKDEVRSGSDDRTLLFYSAKSVQTSAQSHEHWFPAGSGPELGIETRALPEIWLQPDVFVAGVAEFIDESNKLVTAVQSKDTAVHAEQLKRTADTCKTCHDQFRSPED